MREPVVLQTERLVLRPYRLDDVDGVLAYASDERWSRFLLPIQREYTRADAEEWVTASMAIDWDEHPRWAIEHEGAVSGGVDLRIGASQTGELGYSLGPDLWGRGLMPEAVAAVLDWGVPAFDLAKVTATADAENRQSWRVMEKLGMQREGYMRSARVLRGERRDMVWYGILREEWEARRVEVRR
jgi:RimJ/RimL family protein N-acetyltransferase